MRLSGYNYLDVEPAPNFLAADLHMPYSYSIYSGRYGNVYTSGQLLQLLRRSLGTFTPAEKGWEKGSGVVDPFRPQLEPQPFASEHEMLLHQQQHLAAVADLFHTAEVFVFTMGLTESWYSKKTGAIYPLCPGTVAGEFSHEDYALADLSYEEIYKDMCNFISEIKKINPKVKLLLTVSPVPLAATATNQSVAYATAKSKSILRVVADTLYREFDFVDYFPSYEIISMPHMRGQFFEPDMRQVNPHGVAHVMKQFFEQHKPLSKNHLEAIEEDIDDVDAKCDEEILLQFGDTK
jgi:hypothetical protein